MRFPVWPVDRLHCQIARVIAVLIAVGTAATSGASISGSPLVGRRTRPRGGPRGSSFWIIEPGGVGPFGLQMRATAIRREAARYGLQLRRGGTAGTLIVRDVRGGPLVRIAMEGGAVESMEVSDPRFHTPEGARVGMRLGRLVRLYGRGYIEPTELGLPSVYFGDVAPQKALGLDFHFVQPRGLRFRPDTPNGAVASSQAWRRLLGANPRVISISIAGD